MTDSGVLLLAGVRLVYQLALAPPSAPPALMVRLDASGLAGQRDSLIVALDPWGEWAASPGYIRSLAVNGRERSPGDIARLALATSAFPDGRLRITYQIELDGRGRLLPGHRGGAVTGFIRNTLVGLSRGGLPLGGTVEIRFGPGRGAAFTGWGGYAPDGRAGIGPDPAVENGLFVIGAMAEPTVRVRDGIVVEVLGLEPVSHRNGAVADLAAAVLPVLRQATGVLPQPHVRLVIESSGEEGVTRGTATPNGTSLALPPGDEMSDGTRELVTHELFHAWLGERRFRDVSLTWFTEGFTDYVATWAAAAAGLTTPARFAERMLAVHAEIAALPPGAAPPFGAPDAGWRDGGGPREVKAYRGGALVALGFEAALRGRGRSLGAWIGDLLRGSDSVLTAAELHRSASGNGLEEAWARLVDSSAITDPWEALPALGFVVDTEEAMLTYIGVDVDPGTPAPWHSLGPAVVRGLDPTGPAAAAGIALGDTTRLLSERRGNPPVPGPSAPARYHFGLGIIPSGLRPVEVEVARADGRVTLPIMPRLERGGLRRMARWKHPHPMPVLPAR